ncbi:N-acetylmuramoyl-L-alanine amidase [Bradyrhizobium lablabi]|uniref:N-acetylmuramoyl-L-alanine amidase n=1 Tax=Bradyrhizobium lablabi TaxID=722472 RepID=UPI0009E7203A
MKICVDPGHGMSNRRPGVFDSGCTHTENGFLFRESDIVLKYGLTLKDVLRARGNDVFMTRDDGTDHAPVGERARNAKMPVANALFRSTSMTPTATTPTASRCSMARPSTNNWRKRCRTLCSRS